MRFVYGGKYYEENRVPYTYHVHSINVCTSGVGATRRRYGSAMCGMAYVTSVGAHYIYGSAFGATESKTVTVTLYRQSGSKWIYVDSVSQTGTASTVSASKYVSLTKSGTYKVEVHGTTNNSDGTVPYYYNVTI